MADLGEDGDKCVGFTDGHVEIGGIEGATDPVSHVALNESLSGLRSAILIVSPAIRVSLRGKGGIYSRRSRFTILRLDLGRRTERANRAHCFVRPGPANMKRPNSCSQFKAAFIRAVSPSGEGSIG